MVISASGKINVGDKDKECPLLHKALWRAEFRHMRVPGSLLRAMVTEHPVSAETGPPGSGQVMETQ